MVDTNSFFDDLDVKARVMLTIWELTKDHGHLFATPEQIGKRLKVEPGYIRSVIIEIEKLSGQHLSEDRYHAPGKKHGRKRIRYRLHDDVVIHPATALILLELLSNHRNHSADRAKFVNRMVKQHQMTPAGVNNRIDEGIRVGYIEDLTLIEGAVRGKERINEDFDYIKALASKYDPTRSPQRLISSTMKSKTKKKAQNRGAKN